MIRITLIKPLPLKSFTHVNVSYCIGAVMNDFAFQNEAGMQANARLLVNRVNKYDAIGYLRPQK